MSMIYLVFRLIVIFYLNLFADIMLLKILLVAVCLCIAKILGEYFI